MANDRHSVGSCKNLDLQTLAESRWLSTRCQAPRRSAELSIDSRMKLDALVGTLCATVVCRQRANLTESQSSTLCICVSKRPQDVVFGAIFFRIGGPEWTAG